jgi:hypothetical protein
MQRGDILPDDIHPAPAESMRIGELSCSCGGGEMKVAELEAPMLDFWVAKAEGLKPLPESPGTRTAVDEPGCYHPRSYHPSTDWSQGGPLVARQWFELENQMLEWLGPRWPFLHAFCAAPLTWFMRGHVACVFGDEVEDMDEEGDDFEDVDLED